MPPFYSNCKVLFGFLLAFVLALPEAQAQDPRFSQFYASPVQVNPALTGVFPGEYRFVANYRTQNYAVLGNQAYKSIGASGEWRRSVGQDDYFGLGLVALRDQVGESRFTQGRAVVTGSFLKHLGSGRYRSSDQFLVAGAQAGIGQWRYDFDKPWFSQQFFVDPANQQAFVDYNLPTGEDLNVNSTDIFLDFSAGLLYYNVLDENNSFYIGGAMHHLTEPNVSFLDDQSEKLYRRWVGQAGAELSVTRELSLLPAVLVMGQGPAFSTTAGLNLRYSNHDWREVAIRAGIWGHVANQLDDKVGLESTIISAILEVERWQFGLSYDITVSNLATANNSRGAFELSLIYVHPEKTRFKTVCPKF
ncbi:MAG: PorP/SprF family type IX secretion system membrane protein [Lewinella sp.]|nr:PorP/SprF family type IX secretion system membrane protein [Lewinella sp.]